MNKELNPIKIETPDKKVEITNGSVEKRKKEKKEKKHKKEKKNKKEKRAKIDDTNKSQILLKNEPVAIKTEKVINQISSPPINVLNSDSILQLMCNPKAYWPYYTKFVDYVTTEIKRFRNRYSVQFASNRHSRLLSVNENDIETALKIFIVPIRCLICTDMKMKIIDTLETELSSKIKDDQKTITSNIQMLNAWNTNKIEELNPILKNLIKIYQEKGKKYPFINIIRYLHSIINYDVIEVEIDKSDEYSCILTGTKFKENEKVFAFKVNFILSSEPKIIDGRLNSETIYFYIKKGDINYPEIYKDQIILYIHNRSPIKRFASQILSWISDSSLRGSYINQFSQFGAYMSSENTPKIAKIISEYFILEDIAKMLLSLG